MIIPLTEAEMTRAVVEWVNKHKLKEPHEYFNVRFAANITQGTDRLHSSFSAVATLLPCPHNSTISRANGRTRCADCGTILTPSG